MFACAGERERMLKFLPGHRIGQELSGCLVCLRPGIGLHSKQKKPRPYGERPGIVPETAEPFQLDVFMGQVNMGFGVTEMKNVVSK